MITLDITRAWYPGEKSNGDSRVDVLRDIRLELNEAERLVVIGASGCGKSTLLRIAAGLCKTYEGRIPDGEVSYVPQAQSLLPWKTILDNIISMGGGQKKSYAEELMDRLGITAYMNRYPHQLSGGQLQKAALCRAFFVRPKLMLLDEPFSALDEFSREQVQQAFLDLQGYCGCASIFVTHSLEEALVVGQRIVVLSGGPAGVRVIINSDWDGRRSKDATFYAKVNELRSVVLRD